MRDEQVTVRWALGETDFAGAIAVRQRVFCLEQGVPHEDELDGRDEEALHVVAVEANSARILGTLRLLFEGHTAKVGRVAVDADARRRGVASKMLELALDGARAHGCTAARLAAQVQATELYASVGFLVESDMFEEAGIPHVWMARSLP
jgi:ElaA protein